MIVCEKGRKMRGEGRGNKGRVGRGKNTKKLI
jgi:hypothetical protein